MILYISEPSGLDPGAVAPRPHQPGRRQLHPGHLRHPAGATARRARGRGRGRGPPRGRSGTETAKVAENLNLPSFVYSDIKIIEVIFDKLSILRHFFINTD